MKTRMRELKNKLLDQLERVINEKPDLEQDLRDWLFERFGIKVHSKISWERLKRIVLRHDEITDRDLALFMLERDLMPDEDIWFEGGNDAM